MIKSADQHGETTFCHELAHKSESLPKCSFTFRFVSAIQSKERSQMDRHNMLQEKAKLWIKSHYGRFACSTCSIEDELAVAGVFVNGSSHCTIHFFQAGMFHFHGLKGFQFCARVWCHH
jgi:hypothetical protein